MRNIILYIFLLGFGSVTAQSIKGKVLDDANGLPIPYVNVFVPDSPYGTSTNDDGSFTLKIPDGKADVHFSSLAYDRKMISFSITKDTFVEVRLVSIDMKMNEVTVEAKKTKFGNQIIKKLIANKHKVLTSRSSYSNENYIKTQVDRWRAASNPEDSVQVEEGYEVVYLGEIASTEYRDKGKYKAEVKGELINSSDNNLQRWQQMDVARGLRLSNTGVKYNPLEFFRNSKEADLELYKNYINNANLSDRPITSPLGAGAFTNYRFRLKKIDVVNGDSIFTISVDPIFKKAPLFNGNIVVNGKDWVVQSAELQLDNNVITLFKDFTYNLKYTRVAEGLWKMTEKSFSYMAKMNKTKYKVLTEIIDSEFQINPEFKKGLFGREMISYSEEALERDTTIWESLRPKSIQVSSDAKQFIFEQDSIYQYEHSDEYYMAQDSDFNKVTILNVLWSGVNYRKRSKGITFGFDPLVQSINPLGVGGYRAQFGGYVDKEFPSNNRIDVNYSLNYGITNKDLKGRVSLGYTYMPQRFARVFGSVGDTYDIITQYESIQNLISRGNYIQNRRFSIGHSLEVVNGLYGKAEIKYADKRSIEDLTLAGWSGFIFGENNAPRPFERYRSFIIETELLYKFGQRYITRGRKKIVIGNNYPELKLTYIKGLPTIFNSEVNFDHLELEASQKMPNTKLGNTNWRALAGWFINTRSLRFIEYKYYRGSTPYLFAHPLRDYQLLGPTLSTNQGYIQGMVIHHFNGFIMDKIPLINALQLEISAGAAALAIPDQQFLHAEVYAGIGRKFRLFGETIRVSAYAASSDNTLEKFKVSYKFGINIFNAFSGKWEY